MLHTNESGRIRPDRFEGEQYKRFSFRGGSKIISDQARHVMLSAA